MSTTRGAPPPCSEAVDTGAENKNDGEHHGREWELNDFLRRPIEVNPEIAAKMPARLERLPEIAYNFWWSWHREARNLFKKLDYPLWRSTSHNPVRMLYEMTPEQLEARAADPQFRQLYNAVLVEFDRSTARRNLWFTQAFPDLNGELVAYFSAEFGLHQSLPIYSGGLGILSGDHCKEASDLGLPFVAIGFLYDLGYFLQRIPSHGWQEEVDVPLEEETAALQRVKDESGRPLVITVEVGSTPVHLGVWRVDVGRVKVYLMDSQVAENEEWARQLTSRLYRGGEKMRIQQEILLGIGGVRLVRRLGLRPTVWHINEGHPAFVNLERLAEHRAAGLGFYEALERVQASSLFTTHTPVPAGHDIFHFGLMEQYFRDYCRRFEIDWEQFLGLGRETESSQGFNMTVLGLRTSGYRNGVSELHGRVARRMFHHIWGLKDPEEAPIGHVTNGVHVRSWIGEKIYQLFRRYLGRNWEEDLDDQRMWDRFAVELDELWLAHEALKRKLLDFIRGRARAAWLKGLMDSEQVLAAGGFLSPNALTIGFARRFATYKRATLLLRDKERLKRLLLDRYRPVQFIFAGKAHPADLAGKQLLQEIYLCAKSPEMGGRIAVIENYDMQVARYLVQGVDVWLNNPIWPQEASGTSGMKAAINGIPNLSVPDGWWAEGYNGRNGWKIGEGKVSDDPDEQDDADADALYRTLEEEVIPLYYERDTDGIPRYWARFMLESICGAAARFSSRRMVKEYTERYYVPIMRGQRGSAVPSGPGGEEDGE
jgi:starch phosphorylase